SLEQRIQVTTDADTWFSLIVNELLDPSTLKDAILARLNINPMDGPFEYIHENGPYPDSPLSDAELIHLCRMADRSASNRILVRAVNPEANQDIISSPVGGQFAISGNDLWATSPSSPNGAHQRRNSDNHLSTAKAPSVPTASLWAIHPKKSTSASLWATPPSSEPSSLGNRSGSGDSPWPTDGPTTPSKSVSFWATPPSSSYSDKRSDDDIFPMSTGGNTAIYGNGQAPNGTDQPLTVEAAVESLSLKTRQSSSSESSATTYDPFKPDRSDGHLKPPPPNENEFWGERPPLEVIAQNPDRYFDEQNLDREIVETPAAPTSARRGGANLVSRKSIRIKIQETNGRHNSRFQQAANVIRASNIIRRKSTKLWGQKVVQVKPGMSIDQAAAPIKDEKTEILYMLGKLIGKGSFGRVYHAINLNADPVEMIAVKQVEIPTTKSDLMNERQRASIEALYHEISLLEGLDHENIVQYLGYDSNEAEGHLNIFLEYVAGGSISSCLTKFGPFKEPLLSHFTRQILQGLKYLHSKHILHRDIKGGNILVQEDGICKISDFGLSKLNDQDEVYDQNSKMSLQGSIFWMAPEVVKNEPYSAKVDIWSLGCTVIEMYTGKRPWLDMTALAAVYSIGTCKSPPIPEDMSEDAKDFLRQCFIIEPAMRPTATILLSHPFCRMDPNFVFQVRRPSPL
ncbi:kinase-like domain-containing protein, partial [Umbelopsis sp. PMI_123]